MRGQQEAIYSQWPRHYYGAQWTPQQIANIRMQGAGAQAQGYWLNRLREMVDTVATPPLPKQAIDPRDAVERFRALRAAYHARAWK